MSSHPVPLTRQRLLDYFLKGAVPRADWMVGMEVEKMGRDLRDGRPIPYEGSGPSVRKVLERLMELRGGGPVFEADNLIGVDAAWGTISLEPGGQVEWSSRPRRMLRELNEDLVQHLRAMEKTAAQLGMSWLDVAVDPVQPVDYMPWMPKARYKIMRTHLGRQGKLAHRMMTQTASIQCAFDYDGPEDWTRKFKAATALTPVATALFANSSEMDGQATGYRCFRQAIWQDTDPERCGLPDVVFHDDFSVEKWLDWVISVPTIFRHRARGLVPSGGVPFAKLLALEGCDAVRTEDWETHASTVFTEVRSYDYIEVRSADLQPDDRIFAVPTFWTGALYDEDSLGTALELGSTFNSHAGWSEAMEVAARQGLDGTVAGTSMRELATRALSASARALGRGAACAGDPAEAVRPLEHLASFRELDLHT